MLTQGTTAAGTAAAAHAQAAPPPASGSQALRFERDADLDFSSEIRPADGVPPDALALPAPSWIGFGLLCFLCLLAACTFVRPRMIRPIKGRRRSRGTAAKSAGVPDLVSATGPRAIMPATPPGQLIA